MELYEEMINLENLQESTKKVSDGHTVTLVRLIQVYELSGSYTKIIFMKVSAFSNRL